MRASLAPLLFFSSFSWCAVAASNTTECQAETDDGPVMVDSECVDALYATPVIDSSSNETEPSQHTKVSGHFNGTSISFNIYLPPETLWEGKFFQSVYPTQDRNADDTTIGFGIDAGAYIVQTTGSSGYRADAAAAKFSKTVAAEFYGTSDSHIYGYIYGGSGGSFQSLGAMEETVDVWDGAVIFVQAVPVSLPNIPAARAFAGLVLRNQSAQIIDAVRPGGSGDPYTTLNDMEKAMLHEVTTLGIPLHKWEDYDKVADPHTIDVLTETVQALDHTYGEDFWNEPGYLGTEESSLGAFVRSKKINVNITSVDLTYNEQGTATSIILSDALPFSNMTGLVFSVYSSDNSEFLGSLNATLNNTSAGVILGTGNNQTLLDALEQGGNLGIDNLWFIALHAYYRYQIPRRPGFSGWNQFIDASGSPVYPQRSIDVPAQVAAAVSGGAAHTGKVRGKVIVVDNLWDSDAWPAHADWYRTQVQQSLGDAFNNTYRLWYNDHADHNTGSPGLGRTAYLVEYDGILQQALRDLSAWAEKDIAPPESTRYTITENQMIVPSSASVRLGIQPTVDLELVGSNATEVKVGQSVTLRARAVVPPGAGQIVSVGWDFLGTGNFTKVERFTPSNLTEVETAVTYSSAGTFIAGVKVIAQRDGDINTRYNLVPNLGRVRITVL